MTERVRDYLTPGANAGERHLPVADAQELISRGRLFALKIKGSPECRIRVVPREKRIEVLVQSDFSVPNVSRLRNVELAESDIDGEVMKGIAIFWSGSSLEAYLIACAVCDRVQLEGESLATAVDVVVRTMRELFRREARLSVDQEVGLLGEIIVLLALIPTFGVNATVDGWIGALGEEHDFSLPPVDLEIKTTTSEERVHWISSLSQLVPIKGRPLHLVSIQVTKGVGLSATTLPKLADLLIDRAESRGSDIIDKLERVGYEIEDRVLYADTWEMRTPVLEYEVSKEFPRLTPSALRSIGPTTGEIVEVRYRIRVERQIPTESPIVPLISDLSRL